MIAWAAGAIFLGLTLRRRHSKAAGAQGDSTGAPQLQECSRPTQPPLVPPPPRLPPELSSASTHGCCSQVDPRVPSPDGRGACVYVDTASQLTAAVRELSQCERIALDVENHGLHSYAGTTCLLQLSTGELLSLAHWPEGWRMCYGPPLREGVSPSPPAGTHEYLVDALALSRHDIHRLLAPVFSNPRICKARAHVRAAAAAAAAGTHAAWLTGGGGCTLMLGGCWIHPCKQPTQVVHGGGSDVLWLQRDFNLFIVNLFDTEKACQVRFLCVGSRSLT
jgi:cation-transporting P-type ATPase D